MDGDIADFVYVQCTGPHVGAIYSLYEFELGKDSRQRRVSCGKDLRLIDVERPFDSSPGRGVLARLARSTRGLLPVGSLL